MNYKTSVALCTYNGKDFIEQQIDSILNQTVLPDELIISDDGSNDGTVEIVKKKLAKSHLKYKVMINNTKLGVIKNFERAILHCEGDIIFTSDQDDIWLEDKVEYIKNMFNLNEKLSIVFTDAYLVDKNLSKTGVRLWDAVYPEMKKIKTKQDILKALLKGNIMTGATMAFKRSLIQQITPFNEYWIHDYWIAITGTLIGEVQSIDKPLILYRQHDNNVIGASKLSVTEKIIMYFRNFYKLDLIRMEKYNKFSSLREFISNYNNGVFDDFDKHLIYQYGEFWKKMINLKSKGKINGVGIIAKEYFRGNYSRYYNGIRSVIRDIISIVLKKNS